MEKNENISRRDALKRMSKTAMAVAAVAMFPNMDALANEMKAQMNPNSEYCDSSYRDVTNYRNYSNYNDYSNYRDYKNYNNYQDCQYK